MPSPGQWVPVPARPRSNAWILWVGGGGFLLLLPILFTGVSESWPGEAYLGVGLVFSGLLVGLGLAGNWEPTSQPVRGMPAGFGAPPYGLARADRHGWLARPDRLPEGMRRFHRILLAVPLGLVGGAAVLVLAAIIVGPLGVQAVGSGMGIVLGALLLLAAYAVGSYRALLPCAVAVMLAGILVEAEAVFDAWGRAHSWHAWPLLLLALFVPVQAMGAEAAFRSKPARFWGAWTGVGTLLAIGYPVWLFFGHTGSSAVPIAFTLTSFIWGVGALFAFVPVPRALRWSGVAIFAAWSVALLATSITHAELAARLQAAGLVAAVSVCAIAFVMYFVGRARPQAA